MKKKKVLLGTGHLSHFFSERGGWWWGGAFYFVQIFHFVQAQPTYCLYSQIALKFLA